MLGGSAVSGILGFYLAVLFLVPVVLSRVSNEIPPVRLDSMLSIDG